MKERPILFSGPMVLAILEGRKTQTRRVARFRPKRGEAPPLPGTRDLGVSVCPYGAPGDRLWVRETWAPVEMEGPNTLIFYPADEDQTWKLGRVRYTNRDWAGSHRPSIHMPRWASRISLEVVAVRAERLQEISEGDARAEGAVPSGCTHPDCSPGSCASSRYRPAFATLWDKINAERGFGWAVNPFVWVVTFRRVRG